jgi:serine/threonine protein kinase
VILLPCCNRVVCSKSFESRNGIFKGSRDYLKLNGGTFELVHGVAKMAENTRTDVFISYSHRDATWRGELREMLLPFIERHRPSIRVWDDRDISAGEKWDPSITQALDKAKVAVLLVTKAFFASEYIRQKELPLILSLQAQGLKVLWIPVSDSLFQETELAKIQAVHDPNKPLDSLLSSERNAALVKICKHISKEFQPPMPAKDYQFKESTQSFPPRSQRVLPATDHDRRIANELLFCVLAKQLDLIDALQFTKACSEWANDKSLLLTDILINREWITQNDCQLIRAAVARKVERCAGDVEVALAVNDDPEILEIVRCSQVSELNRSFDRVAAQIGDSEIPIELIGEKSLRYRWDKLHAQGNLGQVYSGSDLLFNRQVALKISLTTESGNSSSAQTRLIEEARIAGMLEHPNIVPVYDLDRRPTDNEPYYVMRLLRGPTLADEIRGHHASGIPQPLERRRLVESLLQICFAVKYTHSRGVLHLDLKPDNVALGDYREVYLLDWGLARQINTSPSPSIDSKNGNSAETWNNHASGTAGGPIGTPAYMAPEQFSGNVSQFDVRSDSFGLGAILREILTGKPPRNLVGVNDDLSLILNQQIAATRTVVNHAPIKLSEICDKALSTNPADRYQTVDDFILELQRWLDEEPLQSYRANVQYYEELITTAPRNHSYREGAARNLVIIGLIQNGMGRKASAESSLADAIRHYEELLGEFPRDTRLRSDLALTRLHLYYVLGEADKKVEAENMKLAAIRDYQTIVKLAPRENAQHSFLQSMMSRIDQGSIAEDSEATPPILGSQNSSYLDDAPKPFSDKNLLLGVIALQTNLITQEQLIDGLHAWYFDKTTSLARHLDIQGSLTAEQRAKLDLLVNANLQLHDNSAESKSPLSRVDASPYVDQYATIAPISYSKENEFGAPITGPRYSILRPHARGGLGEVFLARDETLQREVAIKELGSDRQNSSEMQARFLREARITASLEHPGIAPIYSLGTHPDGRIFYAMKFLRGHSLSHAIHAFHEKGEGTQDSASTPKRPARSRYAHGNSEFRQLIQVMVSVCKTINYAHIRGVIHRDIKPQNVMLGNYGETIVLDWGLAKAAGLQEVAAVSPEGRDPSQPEIIEAIDADNITMDGAVMGTPAFMSPEQACGQHTILTHYIDVFSLGATLYQLLTGSPPYARDKNGTKDGNFADMLERAKHAAFLPPCTVSKSIPRALASICLKAMQLRPEDRYQTAQDMADDLERWLAGEPVSVHQPTWLERLKAFNWRR